MKEFQREYLALCILLYVLTSDLPALNIYVQLFIWKKYGSEIPYLPTVWTNVQNFIGFFIEGFPYEIVQGASLLLVKNAAKWTRQHAGNFFWTHKMKRTKQTHAQSHILREQAA